MIAVRELIVDGYNVIRQTPPYRDLARDDLDAARAALVNDIATFACGDWRATVVFDGAGNPSSTGEPHHLAEVTVIFSAHGVDADSVIERLARTARDAGQEALVVTSDAQTQWTVMGGPVTRRSSAEFAGDLRRGDEEWREHAPSGSSRCRVEDTLDRKTRETLARWARGEST